MKRKILVFCTAVLTATACACAVSAAETVSGMIAGITQDGLSLHFGTDFLYVTFSENTVWDTDGELAEGDIVLVRADGCGDHSLLSADVITCYRISGTVSEISDSEEPYLILDPENGTEQLRVNPGSIPIHTAVPGSKVKIWYNGIQTRSVPPQITAMYIRGTVLQGTVTEIDDSGVIRLLKQDGEPVLLYLSEDTVVLTEPEKGKTVRVSVYPQTRLSIPAQYEVQDILPIPEKKER